VIHHLSTEYHRVHAVKELSRILRVGGKLLIYVWAFEQENRQFRQQDVFVPWKMKNNTTNPEDLVEQSSTTKSSSVVYQRYYHVFKKK